MATSYTSLLGLALPVTGELQGTWGTTVNDSITSLLDTAVAGTTTLNTDADVTLSTTTGSANQSRQAILLWTANGTVTRNITAPAQSKSYVVINASAGTQSIVIRGVGPTVGVTIIKGESALVAWNGSDFVKVSSVNGVPLSPVNGGTGVANNAAATVTSSGNFAYTRTLTGVTNVTFPTSGTLSTLAGTETLTNKRIEPRVVALTDATSVTFNADTTDFATQANTQAVGTLTINAPAGTPSNGQTIVFRLRSTNVQTFAWNSAFVGSTDLALPTASSGATKFDYMMFSYNSTAAKWQILAKNFGF